MNHFLPLQRAKLVFCAHTDTSVLPPCLAQVDAVLAKLPVRSRPLVVAIAHCAPERLQLGFPYHAVPSNGWDMVFCDAFGLADTLPPSSASGALTGQPSLRGIADPRRWIAVAYGLIAQPTLSHARAEFESILDVALAQVP
jgi:hypothetical protein